MRHSRHIVFLVNLLFSFSIAVTTFTNSSFIQEAIGEKAVGVLYTTASLLTIAILWGAYKVVSRIGNRTFFLSCGVIHALSLFLLVMPSGPLIHTGAFIGYLLSMNVLVFSLDIFFERTMDNRGRGKARGFYLFLGNGGWVLAPLAGAFIIDQFGYGGTYAIALIMLAIIGSIVQFGLGETGKRSSSSHRAHVSLKHALGEKTLHTVIGTNLILQFFYAWMVIYTPLYLSLHLGFSWDTIGIIFSVMLLPFVLFDYPLGRLADRIGTEKEVAAIGFFIMAASVLTLALVQSPTPILVGGILFFSRVGAAMVETMTEIHFFKIAASSDPRVLSIFRDVRPLAYIIAPLAGSIVLYLFPFRSIFLALSATMIFGFFLSFRLDTERHWWARSHTN